MGLALLPWEKLPPYVLGPLLIAFNLWLFFSDDMHPFSRWGWQAAGFAYGVATIWYGYRKDNMPKEARDKDHTHKDIRIEGK
ncbi:hypothetical protein [Rhodoferax sp. GW822-FHT02A01]|uniref:hypothetical protein n=1 Tax=Rhodoferax sp. GW822-FHT02A01 TaxID=3141537 RepID=UPI00315D9EB2